MKDKSKIGYLGLLGIPLAMLGVVGSVAFAQTTTPTTPLAPTTQSAQVEQTTGPDTDNIQDQVNDGTPDSATEVADSAEAPETGSAADTDGPGGPQDEGVDVGTQDAVPGVK